MTEQVTVFSLCIKESIQLDVTFTGDQQGKNRFINTIFLYRFINAN